MTVPFGFSMHAILIQLVLDMHVAEVDSGITNMGFTIAPGLAREFSPEHSYVLSIGANFALTPPVSDFNAFETDVILPFERRCHLSAFFADKDLQHKDVPPRFVIPSDFHPLNLPTEPDPNDADSWFYKPAATLVEYLGSVRRHAEAVLSSVPKPVHNLARIHRDALTELSEDESIVIAACDKNLGICVDSAHSYDLHAREELARTHTLITNEDYDALQVTSDEIVLKLSRYWESAIMRDWMEEWCKAASTGHDPQSGRRFRVPSFRLLYKIHKDPIEYRPLTGNFCWITQPYALLLSFLLLPFVRATSTYLKDSGTFIVDIANMKVGGDHFLVTYDVCRLYPSIPHDKCFRFLRNHLHDMHFYLATFCASALLIILGYNFCYFGGDVFHQNVGFATGVACDADTAHIFLEELLCATFARHAHLFYCHRRYIDDGIMVWIGIADQLLSLFAELNSLDPNIERTFEYSKVSGVFLDVNFFKGPGWRLTGFLDTSVFQKSVNMYLYTPPSSEHPRHCCFGLVSGEVTRYIRLSSSFASFVAITLAFHKRLRARGFSQDLLRQAFERAPSYDMRPEILSKIQPSSAPEAAPAQTDFSDVPSLVFSPVFSRALFAAGLSRTIFLNRIGLPPPLNDAKFINAYRIGRKIGSRLIRYRFHRNGRIEKRGRAAL